MTLDATKPTDQALVSELAEYIRETREALNSLESNVSDVVVTNTTISGGTTTLVVGTDLSEAAIEIVLIDSLGASDLAHITNGVEGQIKIFIMQDNDIGFVDGDKVDGDFYLNQLPVGTTFDAKQNDVLALVNIDGDGGATTHGYWKELWRLEAVK